ncbi:MAG: cysteine synthase family protein [Verrucomicrobia bacterium]|nr:cysteine synthase family protein [Verrucomicrobiota bacterium]
MHEIKSRRNLRLSASILDVIGDTPMVDLQRCVKARGLSGRLLAKLEYLNPGLSKKDRIALEIVREARADGSLKEGQAVVELTSGNTGTGLTIVCRAFGYPFVAVMSRGNTMERVRMMRALGAEVVLVDQAPGSPPNQVSGADLALVEKRTCELVAERNAFRADQFARRGNVLAHERYTGPEIWKQSGGRVEVFLDFVGTSGTFTGVTRFLRRKNPKLRAYVIEPAGAAILAGKPVLRSSHKIQGGGYSMRDLPLLDRSLVTDYLQVTDEEAIQGARTLAAEEGIFGGFSAGAHLAAALKLLEKRERGAAIAFLICDSGLKYLSTDLFL